MTKMFVLLLTLTLLSACAATPKAAVGAADVLVRDGRPDRSARRIDTLRVVHGHGCGFLGALGDEEGALGLLRNEAVKIGADYVEITGRKAPYSDGQCRHNEFIITGVAYSTKPSTPDKAPPAAAQSIGVGEDLNSLPPPRGFTEDEVEKWSKLEFPRSAFHPSPFTLTNGRYRFDVRQIPADSNAAGHTTQGQELRLSAVHQTDVDADGLQEYWVVILRDYFNHSPGNSAGGPVPTGIFVFEERAGGRAANMGVVVIDGDSWSWIDGGVRVQRDGAPRTFVDWRLANGRLVQDRGASKTESDRERVALLTRLGISEGRIAESGTSITPTVVNLNDDGIDDYVVGYSGMRWCGTSGCTHEVYVSQGDAFKRVLSLTTMGISVEESKTNGLFDLSTPAMWAFNGKSYQYSESKSQAAVAAAKANAPEQPDNCDPNCEFNARCVVLHSGGGLDHPGCCMPITKSYFGPEHVKKCMKYY